MWNAYCTINKKKFLHSPFYILHFTFLRILSIESSCDETSIAVVEDGVKVLSNIIASSMSAFTASGGVIPEEAARKQVECMLPVLKQAFEQSKSDWSMIDAIAVTKGPGLLGSLLVGTVTAKALASIHKKPLMGVHHTLGHLSSTWLDTEENDLPHFPMLTLSASGGHTELWLRTSHTHGELIGRTRDDAAGEAFDKGATLLGLPYPGGPSISKAAEGGNPDAFPFPLPLKKDETFDFSFSGLKTALRYTIRDLPPHPSFDLAQDKVPGAAGWLEEQETSQRATSNEPTSQRANLASSYQAAICLHLVDRVSMALKKFPQIKEVHVVGGVSANTFLRSIITNLCAGNQTVRFPKKLSYCTDNAAMIAAAAEFLVKENPESLNESFSTEASLPLSAAIHAK